MLKMKTNSSIQLHANATLLPFPHIMWRDQTSALEWIWRVGWGGVTGCGGGGGDLFCNQDFANRHHMTLWNTLRRQRKEGLSRAQ